MNIYICVDTHAMVQIWIPEELNFSSHDVSLETRYNTSDFVASIFITDPSFRACNVYFKPCAIVISLEFRLIFLMYFSLFCAACI